MHEMNVLQDHSRYDKLQNYILHQYPRLYRNVPEIRYKNRIHEQLCYEGNNLEAQDSSVQIIHLGYTEEIVKKKHKTARNIRLLQEELREKPNDGFAHFNLANELQKRKELKKALKHYQIAHKNSTNLAVRTASVLQIAKTLLQLNEYTQALNVIKEEIKKLNGKGVVGFAIDYVNQKDKN